MREAEKRLNRVAVLTKKPSQTQVVSKSRYLWVMTGRTALGSASLICYLLGSILLLAAIISFVISIAVCLFAGITGLSLMISGFLLGETKRSLKPVIPITKRTANLLPPEDSLVRASELPLSQQQAELLRAANTALDTPADELLRATPHD